MIECFYIIRFPVNINMIEKQSIIMNKDFDRNSRDSYAYDHVYINRETNDVKALNHETLFGKICHNFDSNNCNRKCQMGGNNYNIKYQTGGNNYYDQYIKYKLKYLQSKK